MPALGLLIGNISFSELVWVIAEPTETEPGISIAYGSFIQNILDFLIIALSIFCVVSALRKVSEKYNEKKRRAAEEAAAAEKAAKEAEEAEKLRLKAEAEAKEEARKEMCIRDRDCFHPSICQRNILALRSIHDKDCPLCQMHLPHPVFPRRKLRL